MGFVKDKVEIFGTKKGKNLQALFDSVAGRNYIRRKFKESEGVDDVSYFVFKRGFKEIKIKDFSVNNQEFVIMDNLIEDIVIDVFFMQNLCISLDQPNEKIEKRNVK